MGAGVEHAYKRSESARIIGAQLGRAALIGLFPLAEIGKWLIVRNTAELAEKCGPLPATTDACFNDYWNAYCALKNAVVNGKSYLTLMIWNTAHYSDYSDPDTLTATQSTIDLLDSDGTCTLEITDKRYGLSDMQVRILPGSSDSTAMFDIRIYFANTGYSESVNNCNMTPGSVNYVATRVGTTRKWKVVDKGLATLPVEVATAVPLNVTAGNVTAGSNGWTSIDANDFLGTQSVKGNTGIYALATYLNTLEKPEHIFIPHKFTLGTDTATMLKALETWSLANNIIPVLGTPSGLNRDQVSDFRKGTGDYTTAFGTTIGGAVMLWPWGTPQELMTEQDTSTGLPPRISPEGVKIGALARVLGLKWIEEAASGIEYGATVFAELERKTTIEDHNVLDPLGIQTILHCYGNIIWGHYSLSSDPAFLDEKVRRLDNYNITSIDVATLVDVSRQMPPSKMRAMGRRIRMFFRSMFRDHQDAFRYDTFEESVFVDVVGQNDLESDEYDAGDIKTAWDTIYAPSAHKIRHQYSHSRKRTEVIGG